MRFDRSRTRAYVDAQHRIKVHVVVERVARELRRVAAAGTTTHCGGAGHIRPRRLRFPDRTGENYSLRHSDQHRWYYYPHQTREECLVFKVYDKKEDGPRFVFHTAFDDPDSPPDAPPRRSIEVRAIAFYDPPPLVPTEDLGVPRDKHICEAMKVGAR